jgi:uncharacterized membrane protein (DUF4010 family)
MPTDDAAVWQTRSDWPLVVGLAIGLRIRLEREFRKGDGSTRSAAGLRTFGLVGLLGGAAVMGLADPHATSAPMANLQAGGRMALTAAEIGVVLTLATNMAVMIPTAFVTGGRTYGRQVNIGVLL